MVCTRWRWCGVATLGHKRGVVGFGPNTRNRAVAARFWARRGEWLSEAMGEVVGWCVQGGGGVVVLRWVTQAGRWDLDPKLSAGCSVMGTPRGMAVGGNGGVLWDGAYEVVVVWWCCVVSR
jgi:hypothetical protein